MLVGHERQKLSAERHVRPGGHDSSTFSDAAPSSQSVGPTDVDGVAVWLGVWLADGVIVPVPVPELLGVLVRVPVLLDEAVSDGVEVGEAPGDMVPERLVLDVPV